MVTNRDGSQRKPRPTGIKGESWTEKEEGYLRTIAPGHSVAEVTAMLNAKFGRHRTAQAVRNRMVRIGVKTGVHSSKNLVTRRGLTPKTLMEAEAAVDFAAGCLESLGQVGVATDLDVSCAASMRSIERMADEAKVASASGAGGPPRMGAFRGTNRVSLSGHLVRDARLTGEGDGFRCLTFTIGMLETVDGPGRSGTESLGHYFEIRAFGDLADHLVGAVEKGTYVNVAGSLRMRTFVQDGRRHSSYYVVADSVELPRPGGALPGGGVLRPAE